MPIFNAEKYINQSIGSVLMQTERDFELILVDDGSKDNSMEICLKWVNKYPELIRLVRKENTGSLLTRRRCLEEAQGKYIYMIDADDCLIDKNTLKNIKKTIENTKCDLIFFNSTIREDKKPFDNYPFKDMEIFEKESLNRIYKIIFNGDGFNALWNKVFSRELVDWEEDYGNYNNITNGTDMFQMLPIVFNAKRIVYCADVYYFYRFDNNASSIIHKFRPTIYTSLRENFLRLLREVKRKKIEFEEIDNVLANRFMKIASTSAYKVRLINKEDAMNPIVFLKEIGEDELFRSQYQIADLNELSFSRRVIIKLLYRRKYKLLNALIRLLNR